MINEVAVERDKNLSMMNLKKEALTSNHQKSSMHSNTYILKPMGMSKGANLSFSKELSESKDG